MFTLTETGTLVGVQLEAVLARAVVASVTVDTMLLTSAICDATLVRICGVFGKERDTEREKKLVMAKHFLRNKEVNRVTSFIVLPVSKG